MNFGFNSNVRVGDKLYHVQTEDRGPSHPFLDTVVYEAGRVVYKRSANYSEFAAAAGKDTLEKQLHEQLSCQHNEVIAGLESGTLTLRSDSQTPAQVHAAPPPPFQAVAAPGAAMDVRLQNPKTWFADGRVTLEVELRDRNSGEGVGGADVEAFIEREKLRTPCARSRADEAGHAALRFAMPPSAGEGAALVIRATDGSLYGELRFQFRTKPHNPDPVSK